MICKHVGMHCRHLVQFSSFSVFILVKVLCKAGSWPTKLWRGQLSNGSAHWNLCLSVSLTWSVHTACGGCRKQVPLRLVGCCRPTLQYGNPNCCSNVLLVLAMEQVLVIPDLQLPFQLSGLMLYYWIRLQPQLSDTCVCGSFLKWSTRRLYRIGRFLLGVKRQN